MNQLDENYFSCDFFYYQVKNFTKDRKLFSDQINRKRFNAVLARHDWSCTTMENLRYLNSVVNEIIYYSNEDWQGIV